MADEEMVTLDQAADDVIAGMRNNPNVRDQSEYGVHRAAEAEAWANVEAARADGKEKAVEIWSALAGKISDKYQDAVRSSKSKK